MLVRASGIQRVARQVDPETFVSGGEVGRGWRSHHDVAVFVAQHDVVATEDGVDRYRKKSFTLATVGRLLPHRNDRCIRLEQLTLCVVGRRRSGRSRRHDERHDDGAKTELPIGR